MQTQKKSNDNGNKHIISATNKAESYFDRYIVEIYDRTETQRDDVALVKSLVGNRPAKILEPFCGNGRILIPLAEAGYEIMGMDVSDQFLRSLDERIRRLPDEVQACASFRKSDVIADEWPTGFDVVILGANCFYELATPEEQEHCIEAAAGALVSGGFLYLDNNHMEGELDPSWRQTGIKVNAWPTGICSDGTQVKGTAKGLWFDASKRLVRSQRTVEIITPDGKTEKREWIQQKHPPSTAEMRCWLQKYGFEIEYLWGRQKTISL